MLWWTLRQLNSRNWKTRQHAVKKLGDSRHTSVVEPVLAALEALGKLGDTQATKPLISLLIDKDQNVRWAAATSLHSLGWQPDNETQHIQRAIALKKWDEATGLGAMAVEPLIEMLKDKDRDDRRCIVSVLGKTGDNRATEPVIKLLSDKDYDIRKAAALALGELGNSKAVEPLFAPFIMPVEKHLPNDNDEWRFLETLGVTGSQPLISPTKEFISWLPLMVIFIENRLYRWPPSAQNQTAENVEALFSYFSFPEAIPYFPMALQSKYCILYGDPTSTYVGSHSYSDGESREESGSIGSVYEVTSTVIVETRELTYTLRYPIAEGIRKAASTLKQLIPALATTIDNILNQHVSSCPTTYVEQQEYTTYGEETWTKVGDHR